MTGTGHVSEAAREHLPPVRLVEAGVFSVSCLRPRGRTSRLFSERAAGGNRARAMLPPSDDTEWLPSPCRLLSLQLQEMTSQLIIVNVNWDDDRCRKLNHGSLRAPRALCSGESAGFLAGTLIINTEKNILLLQGKGQFGALLST